jgi:hypothetical protein
MISFELVFAHTHSRTVKHRRFMLQTNRRFKHQKYKNSNDDQHNAIRQQLVNEVKYDVDFMTEQEQTKEVIRINSFTEFEVKSVAKRRTKMYLASLEKYDSGYQSSYKRSHCMN